MSSDGDSTVKSMPSMPMYAPMVSSESAPVTSTDSRSETASTTPTAGLMRASTSSADAAMRSRACTFQPLIAMLRIANAV